MKFHWPELAITESKPIGSKLVGYAKHKRRPHSVWVSQSEIDSYEFWPRYKEILSKSLRMNGEIYVTND